MAWLGPKPLSDLNRRCIQSWRDHHPGWALWMWCDKESAGQVKGWQDAWIDSLDPITGGLMAAAPNFGEASDILRLELLRKYGGVWVDCDMECLRPIDALAVSGAFCGGGGHPGYPQLENAILGACPQHPLIEAMVRTLPLWCAQYPTAETIYRTGPVYLDYWARVWMGEKYEERLEGGIVTANSLSVHPRSYWYQEEGLEKARESGAYGYHHWTGSWVK